MAKNEEILRELLKLQMQKTGLIDETEFFSIAQSLNVPLASVSTLYLGLITESVRDMLHESLQR